MRILAYFRDTSAAAESTFVSRGEAVDRAERDALIIENLPLVGHLVADLCARATHLPRDEFAAVGALALVSCAENFDPGMGVPFGAYARRRIVGSFADEMRSADWATRGERQRIKSALAVQETLTAALGRTPELREIAAALGVETAEAASALAGAGFTVGTIDDAIADRVASAEATPEDRAIEAERLRYLHAAVEALPERMRMIVTGIYFEDRTVTEIADELGVTHSAVSQQRSEAIRLMRAGLGEAYDAQADAGEPARVGAARRAAYVSRLSERAMGGIRAGVPVPESLSTAS